MNVVTIPRNLTKACKLYLERNYEEAEKTLVKVKEYPHQKSALKAQLALFSWDFDKSIEFCMEYLPYLYEWYSGNMMDESFAMLAFSAIKTGRTAEVIGYLDDLRNSLPVDQNERFTEKMLQSIKQTIDIMNGKTCGPKYIPPEEPMTLNEAVEYLREKNNKKDLTADTPEDAAYILSRMYKKMDCNDFIMLYERFANVQKFTESTRNSAIEMYLYLDQHDKVKQAICDSYRYSWIPVEKTSIMPVSILTYDVNLWSIYTKEMFDYIYRTPNFLFGGVE